MNDWNQISEALKVYAVRTDLTDNHLAVYMGIPASDAAARRRDLEVLYLVEGHHYFNITALGRSLAGQYIKSPTAEETKRRTAELRQAEHERRYGGQRTLFT